MRAVLEQRLARPEFAAAPGHGAAQAAFEAAFATEVATARGQVAATSAVDISKYFEYIEVSELLEPALRLGVPRPIINLAIHFYLGPRRLRIGKVVSRALHPRRSIVAGCTWCTVFIRIIMMQPLNALMARLREMQRTWQVSFLARVYIDDGVITTMGDRHAVAHIHPKVTQLLVYWVRRCLRKMVAESKLQCVAPDAQLRKVLRARLAPMGFCVRKEGELLGSDFSAGGPMRRRLLLHQRRRKAHRRRRKLKWWAALGGNSSKVVDAGAIPSTTYSKEAYGLPPAVLRDLRRYRGAFTRIRCGGASLTAKLATAGIRYGDVDPAVTFVAPPFRAVHEYLWDFPRARFGFVNSWRMATREVIDAADGGWRCVKGPVTAAMNHLRDIGVGWPAPFRIVVDGHTIQILDVPPSHVYEVLRDAARRLLDSRLLERMARERAWDAAAVLRAYPDGIDWEFIRAQLRAPSLTPTRRRALQLVTAAAVWSDERRWLAGYADTPSCTTCFDKVGDDEHFYAGESEAVQIALWWEELAGRPQLLPDEFGDPALAPLTQLCWPPRNGRWAPIEKREPEGCLSMSSDVRSYGDGSGYRQRLRQGRVATWAVARINADGSISEALRGVVDGYYSTVPRGEIRALIEHLRHAGPNAVYVGDCQYVLDVARAGVPPQHLSARSPDPDLWAIVRRLLHDHGATMPLVKVKAHASLEVALDAGTSAQDRRGNSAADGLCRNLEKDIIANDPP